MSEQPARCWLSGVIEERWSVSVAAAAAGISQRTAYRWLGRWRWQGVEGLLDRSSRPLCSPRQLPPAKVNAIRSLRRLRMTRPRSPSCSVPRPPNGFFVAEAAHRPERALAPRATRATQPLRASPRRRARTRRHQAARADLGAPSGSPDGGASQEPDLDPCRRRQAQPDAL
jgi:hypothetical protein